MRSQWQAFLELIWPSRYDPVASHERRIALLQALLAIAIALAAGPEVVLAAEMTTFMELLGAILFLTAMAAGAKLVALGIWNSLRGLVFPIPLAVVVRQDAWLPAKVLGVICIAGHTTWSVAMTLNCRFVGAGSAQPLDDSSTTRGTNP